MKMKFLVILLATLFVFSCSKATETREVVTEEVKTIDEDCGCPS